MYNVFTSTYHNITVGANIEIAVCTVQNSNVFMDLTVCCLLPVTRSCNHSLNTLVSTGNVCACVILPKMPPNWIISVLLQSHVRKKMYKKYKLKSQVVYSKQPKLGLTQEFVVDYAHALWVIRSIKRLVSLMLLKWFLSDSFIYFMYRMFNEIF